MFLPIGDDNRARRTFPFVVWTIFVANVIVWYLELTLGDLFIAAYSAVPFEITRGIDLVHPSALRLAGELVEIPQAPGPSPVQLTLLTAMFLHGSWGHIIGNMLYLLIFADQIEDLLGHFTFLIFYLVCGLAASAAHVLGDPTSQIPSLGASGAIAGVLGAYLVIYPNNRVRVLARGGVMLVPAILVLGMWFVLQIVGQFGTVASGGAGVAYLAHIGGFVAGVVCIVPFLKRRRQAWR